MPLAFEQQPKESAKAFAAFQTYLGMGPQRSLDAVSQKCAKSLPLLKRWSARWEWTLRVAAQAAQVAAVERLAVAVVARARAVDWAQRETALRETEWAMHERAIAAAKRGLDEYLKRDKVYANLADIARMLEIASKLGRLATGLTVSTAPGVTAHLGGGLARRVAWRTESVAGEAERWKKTP